MNVRYDDLYNELKSKGSDFKTCFWLIYAQNSEGESFTSGSINGFKNFSKLISYSENLDIVHKQYYGTGGIYSHNLLVKIPRDDISVQFFNKFANKSVIPTIKLMEIIAKSESLIKKQTIVFSNCKIENFKNNMDEVIMAINYEQRQDIYSAFDSNGNKSGNAIANLG